MKIFALSLVLLLAACGGSDDCRRPEYPVILPDPSIPQPPPVIDPNPPPIYDSPATPCLDTDA